MRMTFASFASFPMAKGFQCWFAAGRALVSV